MGTIANRLEAIRKLMKKLREQGEIRACYEAGPTGYCLYWQLTQLEVECEVIAPSLIPVNKALEVTLLNYLHEVEHVAQRIVHLETAIDEAVREAPAELRAVIEALQALRGVAQTTAATIVSELGSLTRFANPRQLMGYSGLVASKHSSGGRVQRGPITKSGDAHLRRVLVESAWSYHHRPNVTGFLAGCSGQLRSPDVLFPDSGVEGSEDPTKRRILVSFNAERAPAPTRALSPRQLPTNHDPAVPTLVYPSDLSSRSPPRCLRPRCPELRYQTKLPPALVGGRQ